MAKFDERDEFMVLHWLNHVHFLKMGRKGLFGDSTNSLLKILNRNKKGGEMLSVETMRYNLDVMECEGFIASHTKIITGKYWVITDDGEKRMKLLKMKLEAHHSKLVDEAVKIRDALRMY